MKIFTGDDFEFSYRELVFNLEAYGSFPLFAMSHLGPYGMTEFYYETLTLL